MFGAKERVYLDHAATTPLDSEVFSAMEPYFSVDFGNPSSIHQTGHRAKMAITRSREQIASVLNCRPNEIIFTSGGTESDNLALKGVAEARGFRGHLITSAIEHHAVLDTAQYLEKRGVEVTFVGVDRQGRVNPRDVLAAMRNDTFLISIMYANNEIGTLEPVSEIGKEAQRRNIAMHTDAVQAAGMLTLDVEKLHVDMLSLSGHKFYGPKGVGVLYARKGIEFLPQQLGGGQELKRRASTENVPAIIGLAEALVRAEKKRDAEASRLSELRGWLIAEVSERIAGVVVTGHAAERLPGSVSFCFPGLEGEALVMRLSERGFDCSSGSACTSGDLDPSPVLLACGFDRKTAIGSLRVTLGTSTTQEALGRFVDALREEAGKLAKMAGVVDVACR